MFITDVITEFWPLLFLPVGLVVWLFALGALVMPARGDGDEHGSIIQTVSVCVTAVPVFAWLLPFPEGSDWIGRLIGGFIILGAAAVLLVFVVLPLALAVGEAIGTIRTSGGPRWLRSARESGPCWSTWAVRSSRGSSSWCS